MARTAPPSLIPTKMYKHLAAVTVALTALIAMAVDNETRAEVDLVAEAKAVDQSGRQFAQGQANRMADKAPLVGRVRVIGHDGAGFGPDRDSDSNLDGGGTFDGDTGYDASQFAPSAAAGGGSSPLPTVLPPGMQPAGQGRNKGRIGAPKRLNAAQSAQIMAISASRTGGSDHGSDLEP